jgi:hypothetical protein
MSQRPENRQRADGWAEGEGLGMDVRGSKGFEFVREGRGGGGRGRSIGLALL